MLKLYHISFHRVENPNELFWRYVLAYNPCHAYNLLMREWDSVGELNDYRHFSCELIDCLNPAMFKSK